jgi:hypothetical protein
LPSGFTFPLSVAVVVVTFVAGDVLAEGSTTLKVPPKVVVVPLAFVPSTAQQYSAPGVSPLRLADSVTGLVPLPTEPAEAGETKLAVPEVASLVHQDVLARSYWNWYVVACPFGLTDPSRVSVLPPVGVAESALTTGLAAGVNVTAGVP